MEKKYREGKRFKNVLIGHRLPNTLLSYIKANFILVSQLIGRDLRQGFTSTRLTLLLLLQSPKSWDHKCTPVRSSLTDSLAAAPADAAVLFFLRVQLFDGQVQTGSHVFILQETERPKNRLRTGVSHLEQTSHLL